MELILTPHNLPGTVPATPKTPAEMNKMHLISRPSNTGSRMSNISAMTATPISIPNTTNPTPVTVSQA